MGLTVLIKFVLKRTYFFPRMRKSHDYEISPRDGLKGKKESGLD